MDNIVTELLKRYGTWAILALVITGATVWAVAHYQAKPGNKVSILWGMVEYTKSKTKTEKDVKEPRKDQSPATSPSPTVKKEKIGDVTLTLNACRRSNSNIICDFLIISTADTGPDAFMIYIKGDLKCKIIDNSGKQYYANLVELGEKSHARAAEDTLYTNIPKRASL
jgi:hypothetical protein